MHVPVPLCQRMCCGCLSVSVPFEHASVLKWIVYKKNRWKGYLIIFRSNKFLGSTSNPDGLNLFYRPCQAPGWLRVGAAVAQLLLSLQGLHFLVWVSQPFPQSCGSGSGIIFPDPYPEPCRRWRFVLENISLPNKLTIFTVACMSVSALKHFVSTCWYTVHVCWLLRWRELKKSLP